MIIDEEPKAVKLHDWNIGPKVQNLSKDIESKIPETLKGKKHSNDVSWTVGDISKAGRLLSVPPLAVEFDDEQEMRRVYSLIYDVFRYKTVLAQALNDVTFFQIHPKLEQSVYHVWLLFYDLYHRNFKKRDTKNFAIASKLFDAVNLLYAENALWSQKIRLAAAVSRLRIKHCALSLHDLLPAHLKDKKVTEQANHSPLTCWVNSIKVNNFQEFTREIEKTFQLKLASETKKLEKNTFKIDKHCPQILIFHSSMRAKLAKSNFVKEHFLVVQDKSFCRGAATFGKVLLDLGLTGSVIQTHVNSPRTTAYLAILLNQNEKINKLIAFSAGKRKPEYEHYFTELGVTNIKIFSDRLIDSPQDAPYMEEVVAIFATPPNSYSAVTDPIDLVCSRGGDLSMLETLTESEQTKATQDRVIAILEEQRKTLRFAMSRPQIQFVVYETHSELDAENEGMVNRSIKDINRMAKLQHAALSGKTPIPEVFIEEEKSIENGHTGDNYYNSASSKVIFETREKMLEEIEVPDTDLFTSPSLPSLGTPEDAQINWKNEGCFLSLIQRKEVIRLDDKYMIQMAENRGLFGSSTTQNTLKSKTSKSSKKKRDKNDLKFRSRKKLKDNEIRNEASQTNDESEDDSDDEDQLSEAEQETISRSVFSVETHGASSRSILNRLTSVQIRQLVSPDFKEDSFTFQVPSLFLNTMSKKKLELKKFVKHQFDGKIEKCIRKLITKSNNRVSRGKKENSKENKKFRNKGLERVCIPTLSFFLKTSKAKELLKSGSQKYTAVSPCERFNRRNPSANC